MRQYVYTSNKIKIVVKDPENYRSKDNNNKIKVIFEIYRLNRRDKTHKKIASHLIPRGLLKRLGVAMAKNDNKEVKESGEICLLEYD